MELFGIIVRLDLFFNFVMDVIIGKWSLHFDFFPHKLLTNLGHWGYWLSRIQWEMWIFSARVKAALHLGLHLSTPTNSSAVYFASKYRNRLTCYLIHTTYIAQCTQTKWNYYSPSVCCCCFLLFFSCWNTLVYHVCVPCNLAAIDIATKSFSNEYT